MKSKRRLRKLTCARHTCRNDYALRAALPPFLLAGLLPPRRVVLLMDVSTTRSRSMEAKSALSSMSSSRSACWIRASRVPSKNGCDSVVKARWPLLLLLPRRRLLLRRLVAAAVAGRTVSLRDCSISTAPTTTFCKDGLPRSCCSRSCHSVDCLRAV